MHALIPHSVPRALAAGAKRYIGCRKHALGLAVLSNLGHRVNQTTDKADENSRYTTKSNGSVEKDQTAECNRKFVQSADHGVCCRRGHADGPSGGIRDRDSRKTRDDHDSYDGVALFGWEVLLDVGG